MPNLLKVAMIETILSLRQRGWSKRRIARELGIDRETVARHLRLAASSSNPANAPTGSDLAAGNSNPANAPTGSDGASDPTDTSRSDTTAGRDSPSTSHTEATHAGEADPAIASGSRAGRSSECVPWREVIRAKLD